MNNVTFNPSAVVSDWDSYWRGSNDAAAFNDDGVSHPAFAEFWREYFSSPDLASAKVVDIACGTGAIVDYTSAHKGLTFTCVDTSAAAIEMLEDRFPNVTGIVADAKDLPLESNSFDVASSQFGVEYAGLDSVDQMVRLVRPAGRLALIMHVRDGVIFQECAGNLAAIEKIQELSLISAARKMFEEGYTVLRGESPNNSRQVYDVAVRSLVPIYAELDVLLKTYGDGVAGGTVLQLYQHIDRINQNLRFHDPDEVLSWLNQMDGELDAYAGRMSSMCDAAIGEEDFLAVQKSIRAGGMQIDRAETLSITGSDQPIAWVLLASKSASG